jgi:predicted transcriptional regulator
MSENSINGKAVSDAQIQAWADEAERSYDVAELKRRGRPRMGSAAAYVMTIRLDPELESALDSSAQHDHSSRSDVIRDALREWLKRPLREDSGPLRPGSYCIEEGELPISANLEQRLAEWEDAWDGEPHAHSHLPSDHAWVKKRPRPSRRTRRCAG